MQTPFVFGRIAVGDNFTDREAETATLVSQFRSLVNTIIISPRRWGKSSLVEKASQVATANEPDLRIVHIDLFNIRNEEEFYTTLATKVLSATSTRWEDAVMNAKSFFRFLIPKIVVGTDPSNEFSIEFDWNEVKKSPDEILELPEKIANEKGIKIVICIDEFQNIAEFTDPDAFQKKLRTFWQRQQSVAYCLYGSKRHMMLEVFTDSSKPFYKFGNLMFLGKIEKSYLTAFFKERFEATGKKITEEAASLIAEYTDNHPYYSQQLAQLSWLRTTKQCNAGIVREAHASLVDQLSLLFVNITETLTAQQLNFLKALLAGETSFTSTAVMKKYGISSATSVARSKESLVKNDILDIVGRDINFQDPIYRYWLQSSYFKLPAR